MALPSPPSTNLKPDSNTHPPRNRWPGGACDCHAHIFGPFDRFPLKNQSYRPVLAPLDDYLRMQRVLGTSRGVLVQPSPYGTDNSALVAALRSGRFPLRGIALIDDATTDRELEVLHWAGVQGCRIHVGSAADAPLSALPQTVARIKRLGWHLQLLLSVTKNPDIDRQLLPLNTTLVIDHFGGVAPAQGVDSAGFRCLLRLARSGRCWFKLSAPYRISNQGPKFEEVIPIARALVEAAPDRCVWGSDWPHPNSVFMPNDGDLADLLSDWIPDEKIRRRVLVDNPAHLYGF